MTYIGGDSQGSLLVMSRADRAVWPLWVVLGEGSLPVGTGNRVEKVLRI